MKLTQHRVRNDVMKGQVQEVYLDGAVTYTWRRRNTILSVAGVYYWANPN